MSDAPQILIDADNVGLPMLRKLAAELVGWSGIGEVRVVVSGRAGWVQAVDWPASAEVFVAHGWQQADFILAEQYRATDAALVLVTGDGDFVHLAQQHGGPVLVASQRQPAARYRDIARVINPAEEGPCAITDWIVAVDGL